MEQINKRMLLFEECGLSGKEAAGAALVERAYLAFMKNTVHDKATAAILTQALVLALTRA